MSTLAKDNHSGIVCEDPCDVHSVSLEAREDPLIIFELCYQSGKSQSRLNLSVEGSRYSTILTTSIAASRDDELHCRSIEIDSCDMEQDDALRIGRTERILEEERPAESKPRSLRE